MGCLEYVHPWMLALAVRACRRRLLEMSGWQEDPTGHNEGNQASRVYVLVYTVSQTISLLVLPRFGFTNIENVYERVTHMWKLRGIDGPVSLVRTRLRR